MTMTLELPSETEMIPSRKAECVSTCAAIPILGLGEVSANEGGKERRRKTVARIVIGGELIQVNGRLRKLVVELLEAHPERVQFTRDGRSGLRRNVRPAMMAQGAYIAREVDVH